MALFVVQLPNGRVRRHNAFRATYAFTPDPSKVMLVLESAPEPNPFNGEPSWGPAVAIYNDGAWLCCIRKDFDLPEVDEPHEEPAQETGAAQELPSEIDPNAPVSQEQLDDVQRALEGAGIS